METIVVSANVLGKGDARHTVVVDNKPAFTNVILDLVTNGVIVVLAPLEFERDDVIKVSEMSEAFGFLKLRARKK